MAAPLDQMPYKDGFLSLEGGVDSGRSASILPRNQVAWATNATFRGGKAAHRPAWVKRIGAASLLGGLSDPTVAALFTKGRFQRAAFFDGTQVPMLLASIGGHQFRVNARDFHVIEITPPDGPNSSKLNLGWWQQAENYALYQDDQSPAIIFDGASSRRARPERGEVPVGNVMAYTMGRLVVALSDHLSFRVGDLVFSDSGSPETGRRDAMLHFTENQYANEGGDFSSRIFGAPTGYGPIRSMTPLAMLDSQLGQGPLLVGTPLCIFTVQLPFDRTTWKDLRSPIQTVVPLLGPTGQESTDLVNGDVWYRSMDGVRSYILARRQFAEWGNTPISTEVSRVLSNDAQRLLAHGSSALWKNWRLSTCSPVEGEHGVWHRGVVVTDFHLISTMRSKAPPAWEGTWDGLRILQLVPALVDNAERLFAFALNEHEEVELWELDDTEVADLSDCGATPIVWSLDPPSYNCGDGFALKNLQTGEAFIDGVQGNVAFTVKFRSDRNPCWQTWDSFPDICAAMETCAQDSACGPPRNLRPQFRSKLKLRDPLDDFDPINGRKYRTGYEFQPRFEISGTCNLWQFRMGAIAEPEGSFRERSIT